MTERTHILLAEDDHDFGSMLKQYLELHDFQVTWAKDGKEALALVKAATENDLPSIAICVFDVMMPNMDGFTLAENVIKLAPELPFLFLTAKKLKDDRVKGLKLGADDYITKPFEADILVLRLNNILKRAQRNAVPPNAKTTIQVGDYTLDADKQRLSYKSEEQKLTEKEARLIHFFFQHINQLVKREGVLMAVWGSDDFFSGRSMDVFISRLRKYFGKDPRITIESTRGVGLTFRFTPNDIKNRTT
ncbi:MAG: response regulator transcription factor [Flavobacteriales bacterium]